MFEIWMEMGFNSSCQPRPMSMRKMIKRHLRSVEASLTIAANVAAVMRLLDH
jgi:hypothetical protein